MMINRKYLYILLMISFLTSSEIKSMDAVSSGMRVISNITLNFVGAACVLNALYMYYNMNSLLADLNRKVPKIMNIKVHLDKQARMQKVNFPDYKKNNRINQDDQNNQDDDQRLNIIPPHHYHPMYIFLLSGISRIMAAQKLFNQ